MPGTVNALQRFCGALISPFDKWDTIQLARLTALAGRHAVLKRALCLQLAAGSASLDLTVTGQLSPLWFSFHINRII